MHVFVGNYVVDADRLKPPHSETGGSEESDNDLEDIRELTNDEQVQKAITQLPAVSSVDFDLRDVDTQQEDLVTQSGVHTGFTVWGGGGELKTFGVYVMGLHKQAPSRGVWGLSPSRFFLCKIYARRLILTQLHLATESSDTVASCHRIYTIIIRKADHRIIAHGQNLLD